MDKIINPCEICIEEACEGKFNCHCSTCKQYDKCNKFLSATIRITTKCTQSCGHCCFECSPEKSDFMSVEMSEKIKKFIEHNHIRYLNIMGGEFYCHPQWEKILSNLLSSNVIISRIVTNGDWYKNDRNKILKFFKNKDNFLISISKDKWHTNKYADKAFEFLQDNKIVSNICEKLTEESIVPLGRGQLIYSNHYCMFGTFCGQPDNMYSILIDEIGKIYKCTMGIWDYADVDNYMFDFRKRFKEFNQVFYGTFVPNCKSCNMAFNLKR